MSTTNTSPSLDAYLLDDGEPNLKKLQAAYIRCTPGVPGGVAWLDNSRFCRWPNQWVDGRKHDMPGSPNNTAFPFDGASDVRPMTVDDIINERSAMKTTAFWAAQLSPGAANAEDDAANYALALLSHLIWEKMTYDLTREVELAAQYEEHYGWTVLAPRWNKALGIKRQKVTLEGIRQEVARQAAMMQPPAGNGPQGMNGANGGGAAAAPYPGDPTEATGGLPTAATEGLPDLMQVPEPTLADLPDLIADPSREAEAMDFLMAWYDEYVKEHLPEDMQENAPKISAQVVRKVVRDLRQTGEAVAPLPYLAKNGPEISALKPWDEVYIPPELTTDNEIMFQVERVSEAELRNRILTEGYPKEWVEKAVKHKGAMISGPFEVRTGPIGIGGMVTGATNTPVFSAQPIMNTQLIEIVHAVYHGTDGDGIPAVYCTTYHRLIPDEYAKHELVEDAEGDLPYVASVREYWCRSITASRGVPERAHTQQNIIKGTLDSIIDRASITTMPPINVYESPTGTQYKFGPAVKNYVRQGREPQFMEGPAGAGMSEAVEVLTTVRTLIDNSYGLMSPDVGAPRLQMSQGMAVRRFLMSWYRAFKMVLNLYLIHGDDAEFAAITGAPAGWLEAHRDVPNCLVCSLHFDVRELDPELMLKRIETMNTVVIPNDPQGVVDRGEWSADMVRAVMGPMAARRLVLPKADASVALKNKTEGQVLKMFAGNAVDPVDQQDPTAAGMLQFALQNVMGNPVYLRNLNDDALQEVAGPQARMVAQQLGNTRTPDDRFSGLLVNYLKNLKFVGVTQEQNKVRGRTGV